MRVLLNIIWLIFGGLWLALGYFLAGVICCILIITIPFGIASFRIGVYALWPFGRTVIERQDRDVALIGADTAQDARPTFADLAEVTAALRSSTPLLAQLESLLARHRRNVRRIEIPHRYAFGTHGAAARRAATPANGGPCLRSSGRA